MARRCNLADEEIAGVVASHYLEAYRAQPQPRAEEVAASAREVAGPRVDPGAVGLVAPSSRSPRALSLATDEDLPRLLGMRRSPPRPR